MITRLDAELVRRGLARSRGQAKELVAAGRVRLDGRPVAKVSTPVTGEGQLEVVPAGPDWVGRAALKLVGAFEAFGPAGWTVRDRTCLDVGASTGGFSQVLLHHGARSVVALDVGHGQLAEPVRTDPRVQDLSGTSIRDVAVDSIGGPFERVVADLSFISLRLVAPDLRRVLTEDGEGMLLVKPQFEVGRGRLGKNGLVRSAGDRAESITSVAAALIAAGLRVRGLASSPVTGTTGNHEYLLWTAADGDVGLEWDAVVQQADQLAVNGAS